MGCSKSSSRIWDPIRKIWVPATLEEEVRQRLLQKMIGELQFPKGWLNVEKALPTGRRFDIICYCVKGEEIWPLLLVECKAHLSLEAAIMQVEGYNHTLDAPFLCVASMQGVATFWWKEGKRHSVPFLPCFSELVQQIRFL